MAGWFFGQKSTSSSDGGSIVDAVFGFLGGLFNGGGSAKPAGGTGVGSPNDVPTLKQFINLSNWAYSQGSDPLPVKLDFLQYHGTALTRLDNGTGFYGAATVTPQRNVIIGFEGTNFFTGNDTFTAAQVADDGSIYLGQTAASFKTALAFARTAMKAALAQGYSKSDIFVTGHSLGAAEAEYVATKLGLGGTTFGTPGINTSNFAKPSQLTNYVEKADPVGNYAHGSPLGSIVFDDMIRHYGGARIIGVDPFDFLPNAAADYAKGTAEGYAEALANLVAALPSHSLANYAQDLGIKLAGRDRSIGGRGPTSIVALEKLANAFFEAAFPSSGTVATPTHADPLIAAALSMVGHDPAGSHPTHA